ncbi:MAG: prolipoprotein diacylglyceryl transferase [Anaerovoracaceae bacterium]
MHPYIELAVFNNLSIGISAYKLFFILACLAVLIISYIGIKNRGLDLKKSALILLMMTLAVPIGARVLHFITNPVIYQLNPEKLWALNLTGFALMGGLILAALLGVFLSRLLKYNLWPLADSVASGLGIGIAIMRVGCYLNGCCFGKTANLPWAVEFPMGSIPYNYYLADMAERKSFSLFTLINSPPIHPTQLYELLAALLITLIVLYLIKKNSPAGVPFLAFSLLFSLFRWFNSSLRVPAPTLKLSPCFYPLLYALIALLSIFLIIYRCKRGNCLKNL